VIVYKKAKTEQAAEIKKLLRQTWNIAYEKIYSQEAIDAITSEWHSITFLEEQIRNPRILFLVGIDQGKIVATCNTDEVKNEVVNIQRIHVLPAYQRKGIGSQLIKEVVKHFPKAKKLQLEVEEQNDRAKIFYENRGFTKVSEKVFEVAGFRMPSIVMEKSL